jgi:predicted transcriptional regulator
MLQSVLNALFGCGHQRTTFPITPGRRPAGATLAQSNAPTYVVCLDCGKKFTYDWKSMRVGDQMVPPTPAAEAQPLYR